MTCLEIVFNHVKTHENIHRVQINLGIIKSPLGQKDLIQIDKNNITLKGDEITVELNTEDLETVNKIVVDTYTKQLGTATQTQINEKFVKPGTAFDDLRKIYFTTQMINNIANNFYNIDVEIYSALHEKTVDEVVQSIFEIIQTTKFEKKPEELKRVTMKYKLDTSVTQAGGKSSKYNKTTNRFTYKGRPRVVYKSTRKNSASFIMISAKLVNIKTL